MGSRQRTDRDGALLLTGATGFLGKELLVRYLERTERRIYAFVRARDDGQADERLRGVVAELFGDPAAHRERLHAVRGDVEAPGLGLEPTRRTALAREVTEIVHSAASVSFTLPLAQTRRVNVEGARNIAAFAELCMKEGGLDAFDHVSTAYVAGDHEGTFGEDDLDVGQGFRNSYERTKFEAEQLVRGCADRLPVRIFRPSIIVGESDSGWTASFNVLYPPLRAFEAGASPAPPARPDTPVDVVPVDFVADAILELSRQEGTKGKTHHLVAGERATTVRVLAEIAGRYFRRRPPVLVSPALYRFAIHPMLVIAKRGRLAALRRLESLFPYLAMRVRFDDREARCRLDPAGVRPPVPESYFQRLLEFATAARWGKRPLTRAEARSQPLRNLVV